MREVTLAFNRDGEDWFADVPRYLDEGGDYADLQMVAGADTLLEIMSQGEDRVRIKFATENFAEAQVLILKQPYLLGGIYHFIGKIHQVDYDFELWLCEVTKYVLGSIPKIIFFKQVS